MASSLPRFMWWCVLRCLTYVRLVLQTSGLGDVEQGVVVRHEDAGNGMVRVFLPLRK